eukprot:5019616-Pleurochrysis_carterae.AAC.2
MKDVNGGKCAEPRARVSQRGCAAVRLRLRGCAEAGALRRLLDRMERDVASLRPGDLIFCIETCVHEVATARLQAFRYAGLTWRRFAAPRPDRGASPSFATGAGVPDQLMKMRRRATLLTCLQGAIVYCRLASALTPARPLRGRSLQHATAAEAARVPHSCVRAGRARGA